MKIEYNYVTDVMVLNEIIEQAGRQSRASEQNGMKNNQMLRNI